MSSEKSNCNIDLSSDAVTIQKMEWVTPKISLMEIEVTAGTKYLETQELTTVFAGPS